MKRVIIGVVLACMVAIGAQIAHAGEAVATFAGGCFWCMEPPYDKLEGVESTISGFMGGHVKNPSYEQVVRGGTGHAEVVQVSYNPALISYEELLSIYWLNIDPVDAGGQFCDRGSSYRSEIFYHTPAQERAAKASKKRLAESGRFDQPIATTITKAGAFYPAESYHQNYYQENPVRYKFYRWNCGRDQRLEEIRGVQGGGTD